MTKVKPHCTRIGRRYDSDEEVEPYLIYDNLIYYLDWAKLSPNHRWLWTDYKLKGKTDAKNG